MLVLFSFYTILLQSVVSEFMRSRTSSTIISSILSSHFKCISARIFDFFHLIFVSFIDFARPSPSVGFEQWRLLQPILGVSDGEAT